MLTKIENIQTGNIAEIELDGDGIALTYKEHIDSINACVMAVYIPHQECYRIRLTVYGESDIHIDDDFCCLDDALQALEDEMNDYYGNGDFNEYWHSPQILGL